MYTNLNFKYQTLDIEYYISIYITKVTARPTGGFLFIIRSKVLGNDYNLAKLFTQKECSPEPFHS